jgi:hypothetical protein
VSRALPVHITHTLPGVVAIVTLGAIGVVAITSVVGCGLSSHCRGPPVPAVCFMILVHRLVVLGLPCCHVVGLPWLVSLCWSSLLSLVFVGIAVAGVIWVDGIVVAVGGLFKLLLQLPFGSWAMVLVVVVVVVVV